MNDARQGLVQRLKITEREKDSLEDARIAAEAYMDKERECTEAQCTIYQARPCTVTLDTLVTMCKLSLYDYCKTFKQFSLRELRYEFIQPLFMLLYCPFSVLSLAKHAI